MTELGGSIRRARERAGWEVGKASVNAGLARHKYLAVEASEPDPGGPHTFVADTVQVIYALAFDRALRSGERRSIRKAVRGVKIDAIEPTPEAIWELFDPADPSDPGWREIRRRIEERFGP